MCECVHVCVRASNRCSLHQNECNYGDRCIDYFICVHMRLVGKLSVWMHIASKDKTEHEAELDHSLTTNTDAAWGIPTGKNYTQCECRENYHYIVWVHGLMHIEYIIWGIKS